MAAAPAAGAAPPIDLELSVTPGLVGPAPFWVEIDASRTRTVDPTNWIRSMHIRASDGTETDTGVLRDTFTEPGRYTVTIEATDSDGVRAEKTLEVTATLPSGAATAGNGLRLSMSADPGFEGPAPFWVQLDGGKSTTADPNDWIFSYRWRASDGGTGSGTRFEHTFARPGSYAVTLTAEDMRGRRDQVTRVVTVTAPEATAPRPVVAPRHEP